MRLFQFLSGKLTDSKDRTWDVRDKEAYAIVSELDKWGVWIGIQPVLVLTDNKALEHWTTEILGASAGICGRRVRWHQKLRWFNLTICYVPGEDNTVANAMSRYAYPASQWSRHGSADDDQAMRDIISAEKNEADEEEYILLRLRAVHSEPLRPGRRVLIVALPSSEDEHPLE